MGELFVRTTGGGIELPALIARAGDRAARRFVEFFTVNIRNRSTRAAYSRAAAVFLTWCEARGLSLAGVQPVHVAAYIEGLQGKLSAPTIKQHLACIRMLFDALGTGQVVPLNPAHAVRGPRHSVSKGATRVISSPEATALPEGMDVSNVVGFRDRALIAGHDVGLRPCECGRCAHRRRLLPADTTLVGQVPREKR
jgi:integrase/recombinase XerD